MAWAGSFPERHIILNSLASPVRANLVLYSDYMKSLVLFLVLCPYICAQDAHLEGTAIDSITRQPLEGVHITISGSRANIPPVKNYGVLSGSDGHFSIVGLSPGKYGWRARRNGFLLSYEKPNSQFVLGPGENKSGLLVEMTPEAVITGRVVDEFGDPAQAIVRATPVPPNDPDPFFLQNMNSLTDERGQFRIVGAPGKFYVSASTLLQGGPREIRTDGTETPVYGETWYPSSDTKARAATVEAIGGRETPNIDLRLVRKRSLSISGVVTGIPGATADQPARAELVLSSKYYNHFFNTDANGQFSLSGLAPGHYDLIARILTTTPPLFSQPVEVPPETTDVAGINLRLVAGEEVSGTLQIEGKGAKPGAEGKWNVRLEPLVRNDAAAKGGEVDREGIFQIAPVYPGTLRVHVTPLPENAYIKSVQLDGGVPGGEVVDLSRGVAGSNLKITIGLNGGHIEGTVSVDGSGATIAFVETADDIGQRNTTYVMAGKQYRFTGLHPAKYRLIVAPTRGLEPGKLEGMFLDSPEIEVHEGERIVKDVNVPKEKASEAR